MDVRNNDYICSCVEGCDMNFFEGDKKIFFVIRNCF